MATIGKVSAVFTANTTGLTTGTQTALAAFGKLGGNARALGNTFQQLQSIGDRGVGNVGPAADISASAIGRFTRLSEGLQQSLLAGRITADDFARRMQLIESSATQLASTMSRGVSVTEQFRTQQERAETKLVEYDALLKAGAITQETYGRAVSAANQELDAASGYTARLAAVQAEYDQAKARGVSVAEQFMTAEERNAAAVAEYSSLLADGFIDQETFDRAVAASNKTLEDATGVTAAAAAARAEHDAIMSAGEAVAKSVMTAEERHAARLDELNTLHERGAIDVRTYLRAVDAANDELRDSQAGANAFKKATDTVQASAVGVTRRLNALIAIQGAQLFGSLVRGVSDAVRSMVNMGQAQADVIDSTSKLAARLGFTYGELAGLSLAADLSGVSMDQIAAAATKADVAFVKAANGSKTARATFDRLGLSMETLNGMSASERFDAIAASIAALPTEAERAAAAVQIFGRSGAELLPLFSQGAAGIAAARAEAEAFGLTLTNEQGQNVEAMNDAFTRAQQAIQGVVGQIVAYLSPAVEAVTTAFSDFIGSVGGANIGQAIGDALLQGAQFFAGIADFVIAGFGSVFEYASTVAGQWLGAFGFAGQIASAFAGVGRLLSTVFLGIVRVALTPLMFIIEQAANLLSYVPGIGSTAEAVGASVAGFRQGLDQSVLDNAGAAATNFSAALDGSANAFGQQATGPMAQLLEDMRQRAANAAANRDTAARQTVGPQAVAPVAVGPSTEALKATDSTSKEGIAEMFRLMRGDGGNVQEEQLGVLEQIRDTLQSQPGDEWTEAAFAGT